MVYLSLILLHSKDENHSKECVADLKHLADEYAINFEVFSVHNIKDNLGYKISQILIESEDDPIYQTYAFHEPDELLLDFLLGKVNGNYIIFLNGKRQIKVDYLVRKILYYLEDGYDIVMEKTKVFRSFLTSICLTKTALNILGDSYIFWGFNKKILSRRVKTTKLSLYKRIKNSLIFDNKQHYRIRQVSRINEMLVNKEDVSRHL